MNLSEAECNAMVRRLDNQDELIHHYKQRMRAMLPYMRHKAGCQLARPSDPAICTCGANVLFAIVQTEVYDENGNPV